MAELGGKVAIVTGGTLGIGRAGSIIGPVMAGQFMAWRWTPQAIFMALAVPALGDSRLEGAVEAIAERLGVPVVEQSELGAVAEVAGGLLPAALRP